MERFKVVERETKTKAYSKEGKLHCKVKGARLCGEPVYNSGAMKSVKFLFFTGMNERAWSRIKGTGGDCNSNQTSNTECNLL